MMRSILLVSELMNALSEPVRLEALRLLGDGREHCVCELMRLLGATQSRMSRHMGVLKSAGIVTARREAQWVYYRRNPNLKPAFGAIVNAVLAAMPASNAGEEGCCLLQEEAA